MKSATNGSVSAARPRTTPSALMVEIRRRSGVASGWLVGRDLSTSRLRQRTEYDRMIDKVSQLLLNKAQLIGTGESQEGDLELISEGDELVVNPILLARTEGEGFDGGDE